MALCWVGSTPAAAHTMWEMLVLAGLQDVPASHRRFAGWELLGFPHGWRAVRRDTAEGARPAPTWVHWAWGSRWLTGPGWSSFALFDEGPCACLSLMAPRNGGSSHRVPLVQKRALKPRDWPEQDSGPPATHNGAGLCVQQDGKACLCLDLF